MIDSISSQVTSLAAQGQAAIEARAAKSSQAAPVTAQKASEVSEQSSSASEQAAAVTVTLSDQAQAKSLKTEGYSVAEIATKLGADIDTVNGYLNIGE
jgi:hypothetical protein